VLAQLVVSRNVPSAWHVSTLSSAVSHPREPGTQVPWQAAFKQPWLELAQFVVSIQLPLGWHVSTKSSFGSHWTAPGLHCPPQTFATQRYWQVIALPHVPPAKHDCWTPPEHSVSPGVQAPMVIVAVPLCVAPVAVAFTVTTTVKLPDPPYV
jgi:hypothetical protein